MAKRGRPPKPEEENGIHKKSYYTISPMREKKALHEVRQDRLIRAYEKIFLLAYDGELSWSYKERLKEEFREEGLLL
jgi:hypothetical protein